MPRPQPEAPPPSTSDNESRVLVLAPLGRDSAIAVALLREAGLHGQPCRDLPAIVRELEQGAGCVVVTQEAIQTADLHPLSTWLEAQPAWSDLPIVVIAERGGGPELNPGALRVIGALGNVSFLERPFRPLTLLSLVQSALRSRRRQFEARAQLAELSAREHSLRESQDRVRASEEGLRRLNEMLEQLVAERTARLQVNEARLRTVFESTHHAQFLLETDGTLLEANTTALDLIGAKLSDVAGLKFCDTPWFANTAGLSDVLRTAIEASAAGADVRREITIALAGAERTFDLSLRPVRNAAGQVVAIVPEATELTSTRQVEEALRQAQKMEAVGQLTGGIAHDFNNMLQGIASGIELMRRRIKDGRAEQAERYIEAAQQGIERAAALVHRLLAFSRRQALAPKRVELDELIAGMADLVRQTVGPAIDVKVELADGVWPIECDPNQMESALLNLAINARDAMSPSGGQLKILTRHVSLGESDLAGWPSAQPGDYVQLTVTDTGVGMTPEILQRVFEPFFTTKPAGQGTGLGLSQVFGFVSQSNGIVRIDSKPGAGTAVSLSLPRRHDTGSAEPGRTPAAVHPAPLTAATVLLVEDQGDVRRFAAEALRETGCTVLEARDAAAGLRILRELVDRHGEHVDLLVSDVRLPGGLNGPQLADAARALAPGLPVLLITGYAGEALAGFEPQADIELLTKPFTIEALTDRVERMLAGSTAS